MLRGGFLDEVIKSDSLLRCVACYACMAKCPRGIRLTDVLLPLVKEQVLLTRTEMPTEFQKSLENLHRYGNPMGESPRKRAAWTATAGTQVPIIAELKREVDVLWFVECYTSFYARGQDNSRATAKLFHALGVDFAILGNEEKCAGECGQMTWESGLFESLAEYNVKLFAKYKFRRLVTGDAHAYNAFHFRYPMYGMTQPAEHTTQFFARHLDQLKPKLKKPLNLTVTFHDACCLGRAVGAYDEPRALLAGDSGGASLSKWSTTASMRSVAAAAVAACGWTPTTSSRAWSACPNGASRKPSPPAPTCWRWPAPTRFRVSKTR